MADDLRPVTEVLAAIKRSFRVADQTEVKMAHVGAESDNPLIDAGYAERDERKQFPHMLLRKVVQEVPSFRAICVGINVGALQKPRNDPVDWAAQLLFERCQFLLDQEHEGSALLFFDNEPERKADIEQRLREGSYYRRNVGFSEPPSFHPSRKSPGLQVADFVAGAGHRYWNHEHDAYVRILWDSFYRQYASPLGSGFKSFPENHYPGL